MPLGWVPVAADVCAIAAWIVKILLGLFSVYLYRNHAKKNIDKICTDYPEGNARTDALLQKGGTSPAALLYYGIMLLLALLVINLAGPSFVQYVNDRVPSAPGIKRLSATAWCICREEI